MTENDKGSTHEIENDVFRECRISLIQDGLYQALIKKIVCNQKPKRYLNLNQ